jgi:hypothetical protein
MYNKALLLVALQRLSTAALYCSYKTQTMRRPTSF